MVDDNRKPYDPIVPICVGCSDNKKAETQRSIDGWPPERFVGKHVKLGFTTGLKDGPQVEHMWVEVEGLYEGDEDEEFSGRLDNHPAFVANYQYNDGVAFKRSEIEEVIVD